LAIDDGITSSDRTVAASKSVANVASEFLSATKRNTEPVKADPNVKLTFDMPKVTSTAGVETKKKEELKANEAKDAKAAAYAAEIAAKSSKTDSAAAGSASVNMPKDEKAAVVVTPTEPTELLSHPLKTLIPTSPFGVRVSPITGAVDEFHRGQDYSAACGTDVFATAGGTVIYTQWHPYGGGNRVEIDHGNGLITTYNHLSASKVKVGQKVERGELIALSGTTGASTGCHLHFEVEVNHKVVNPLPWL
jgi:murein DD-endopeptidase MepM/ murein hydrolase activator NlpD